MTNYPKTIDPRSYPGPGQFKASLDNFEKLEKNMIVGFQVNKEDREMNCIKFNMEMYPISSCPKWKPERANVMNIEIAKINLYFVQEQLLRLLDYFMDKFVWGITDTNPYLTKELRFIED